MQTSRKTFSRVGSFITQAELQAEQDRDHKYSEMINRLVEECRTHFSAIGAQESDFSNGISTSNTGREAVNYLEIRAREAMQEFSPNGFTGYQVFNLASSVLAGLVSPKRDVALVA